MADKQSKKASDKAGRNKKYAENYVKPGAADHDQQHKYGVGWRNKLRRMLRHIRQGRHADDLATAAMLIRMGVNKNTVAELRTEASASTERKRKDKAAMQRRRDKYMREARKQLPVQPTPDSLSI